MNELEHYRDETGLVQQPRILMLGQVGAGKSAFINSVVSAFKGKVTWPIFTDEDGYGSCATDHVSNMLSIYLLIIC